MATTRYFAFLRAINVGGHTVKMPVLKKLFEELGFTDVETFIASGNVIFTTDKARKGLEKTIEDHLEKGLGYGVATFLRTDQELQAVAAHREPGEHEVIYVGFLQKASKADLPSTETDHLHVEGHELYWVCDTKLSQSKLTGAKLEKALGQPTTLRNHNTVRRLVAKYCQ